MKPQILKQHILKANSKKGFKFIPAINRQVKSSHVRTMVEAITHIGAVIRPVVVCYISYFTGVKELYVLDAQHLYRALMQLELDIPYVILPGEIKTEEELIEKIAMLNNSSKAWVLEDYIQAWSCSKESYKHFRKMHEIYNTERTMLAELLHTGVVSVGRLGGNTQISSVIKRGQLQVRNEKHSTEVLKYMNDLRLIIRDLGRQEQRLVISLLIERVKADGKYYNHKAFKEQVRKHKEQLILASGDVESIRNLLR